MSYDFTPLKTKKPFITSAAGIGTIIAGLLVFIVVGIFVPQIAYYVYILVPAAILYLYMIGRAHNKAVTAFAATNGLLPGEAILPPFFDGVGYDQKFYYCYAFAVDGKVASVAEYQYLTGEGKSRQVHSYTIGVFAQDKSYPHLFLDGQQNGKWGAYSGSQRLSLEGDFDKFFNLYVPSGKSVDALSILTPDVMQTLVTGGRPYDIEIQENLVFVVGKGSHYTYDGLPQLLKFMTNLSQEFDQKNVSWQDTELTPGTNQELTRSIWGMQNPSQARVVLLFIIIVFLMYYIFIKTTVHIHTPNASFDQ
jgi:hypothetical protein